MMLPGCTEDSASYTQQNAGMEISAATQAELDDIPAFTGDAYVVINENEPDFEEEELTTESYEEYSKLDSLGRCQTVMANISEDLMPTEERGEIWEVKPTGWEHSEYEFVDGESLYNRCHLIGFQLTGENDNERNLITGTRYLNVEGMLPFENLVADYIRETGNHVLYRVTPVFEGDNLVASGVHMEAMSVEDDGEGVSFNIYAYNNQPGIVIDYATGDNHLDEDWEEEVASGAQGGTGASGETTYILNTNNHKFHEPSCSGVPDIRSYNKKEYTGTREEVLEKGYEPCGRCHP